MQLNSKNNIQLLSLVGVMALVVLACTNPFASNSGDPTATPTFVVPTLDATLSSLLTTTPTPLETETPTPTETPTGPTATPFGFVFGTTTPGVGSVCINGDWSLDMVSVVSYITSSLSGRNNTDYSVASVNGQLNVSFLNGQASGSAQNFQVVLTNNLSNSSTTINAGGNGSGAYVAGPTTINFSSLFYTASGSVTTPFTTYSLDLNGLLDYAKQYGFATNLSSLITNQDLTYICSGNSLIIKLNQFGSINFSRVSP